MNIQQVSVGCQFMELLFFPFSQSPPPPTRSLCFGTQLLAESRTKHRTASAAACRRGGGLVNPQSRPVAPGRTLLCWQQTEYIGHQPFQRVWMDKILWRLRNPGMRITPVNADKQRFLTVSAVVQDFVHPAVFLLEQRAFASLVDLFFKGTSLTGNKEDHIPRRVSAL